MVFYIPYSTICIYAALSTQKKLQRPSPALRNNMQHYAALHVHCGLFHLPLEDFGMEHHQRPWASWSSLAHYGKLDGCHNFSNSKEI